MKYIKRKDSLNRIHYTKLELEYLVLKGLKKNSYLLSYKDIIDKKLTMFGGNLLRINNSCIVTGRVRGVLGKVKVFRMIFKKKIELGIVEGIVKK